MAEAPATRTTPKTKKTFCRVELCPQRNSVRAAAQPAATSVQSGEWRATVIARSSHRGAWYRKGRMMNAGTKNSPMPINTQAANSANRRDEGFLTSCIVESTPGKVFQDFT